MDLSAHVSPGLIREETFTVEDQHTAYHIGSGDERVLGTPWMISFMERVANRLVAGHLPDGYMSVGVHVDVEHLAATPVKARVRIRAEVLEVVKNRVHLSIEAWDEQEKIGEGSHWRSVVEKDRFMKRVLSKQ
ncbi:MAG: thioesterase [Chloroflexi bacterium]|nr:thioesterase [Chloroflexota bacterium]